MVALHRLALLSCWVLASCERGGPPREQLAANGPPSASATATPSAAASGVSSGDAPVAAPASVDPPSARCRAVRVSGAVSNADGAAVAAAQLVLADEWWTLCKDAEVSVQHTLSGREWLLTGPARVLPCRAGTEQMLLQHGRLRTTYGVGVRPGAEAWLFVPGSSIRYGDAELRLDVQATRWSATLLRGKATIEAWSGAEPRVAELSRPQARHVRNGPVELGPLLQGCESSAVAAEQAARAVLSSPAATLGPLAAAQMRARREARSRCGAAWAAVEPSAPASTRSALERSDQRWQQIPKTPENPAGR